MTREQLLEANLMALFGLLHDWNAGVLDDRKIVNPLAPVVQRIAIREQIRRTLKSWGWLNNG